MKKPDKYNITYDPHPWAKRFIGTTMFYMFLGFLVWLSIGSTWWTFFFGTMALLVIFGRILKMYDEGYHPFHTKAELVAFVDALPDDTPGDKQEQ